MRQRKTAIAMVAALAVAAVSVALVRAQTAPVDVAAAPSPAEDYTLVDDLAPRAALTQAVLAGDLGSAERASAAKKAIALSARTILNRDVVNGDPLAFIYTVRSGDTLASIMKRQGCNVPAVLIQRINGMKDGRLKVGDRIKLLKGTVHGRLDKHQFTLDVYLQNGSDKALLRRVKVATGKNNATPEGSFRIAGKAVHALWVPPKSMKKTNPNPVSWGQKGYPLGKDGYFMSLRGIDDATRSVKGYGIHGTNAQWSIGKAKSHGCIRVGEGDIGPIFNMFTEGASTVKIVP